MNKIEQNLLRFFKLQEMFVLRCHHVVWETIRYRRSIGGNFLPDTSNMLYTALSHNMLNIGRGRTKWLHIYNNKDSQVGLFEWLSFNKRKRWGKLVLVKLRILCSYR